MNSKPMTKPAAKLATIAAAMVTALTVSTLMTTPAHAVQSDNKRFKQCQSLKSAGTYKWTGIASGVLEDVHSVWDGPESFHAKACFQSQQACNIWVKRIWWEIPEMNDLRTAYCKPA